MDSMISALPGNSKSHREVQAMHHPFDVEPFLKWPGGKRWIARELTLHVASKLKSRYYEPFLGGGAVFFALQPRKATLSDINAELINVYRQVKKNPDELIEGIRSVPVSKEKYYFIRNEEPKDPLKRAIRFLYLNRTAFGGIYRLNSEGKFNVPYGGKRTPEILWKNRLIQNASRALKGIKLVVSDFEKMINEAQIGDIVYCDPTYTVAHDNNSFIRYNERNFSWNDQERLAKAAIRAYERGSVVIISNACCQNLIDLYNPFQPQRLTRKSLVCPISKARRDINEYLFILDKENTLTDSLQSNKYIAKFTTRTMHNII
jgi:DNA adenine methylase